MNPLMIVRLKGTQAEMGQQYGALVASSDGVDIEAARELTSSLSARLLADANHRSLKGRITGLAVAGVLDRGRRRLERHRPKEYRDRVSAFMEAAGLPASAGRHVVLMDVFQAIIGVAGRLRLGPFAATSRALNQAALSATRRTVRPTPACSSLAVWGDSSADGALRHARNFDFPCIGLWDKAPAVVFCEPDDGLRYGYVGAFGLDVPGCTSFNEAGLTIAAHTRFHSEATFTGAAVMDVCHEISRRAETLADAERILAEHPPAAPWGLMVTSAREGTAAVFETTGKRCVRVDPAPASAAGPAGPAGPAGQHLSCTNWNRHPDVIDGQVAPYPTWPEHSDTRWRRLEQIAASARDSPLTRVDLMRALGDHVDPHTGAPRAAGGSLGQADSVSSVVFDSTNESLCVSTGDAPTGRGPYVDVAWAWDGLAGAFDAPGVEPHEYADLRQQPPGGAAAFALWTEATRIEMERHTAEEVLPLVEDAAATAASAGSPDASYLFTAGVLRLRAGDLEQARVHLDAAVKLENAPFREAQIHLWLARTLDALKLPEHAAHHRDCVLALDAPHIAPLHGLAKQDAKRGAPWPARRLRRLTYSLELVDASL